MTVDVWSDRWRAVVPPQTPDVLVATGRRARRRQAELLAELPSGVTVVLRDPRRRSRRRCRRVADRAGLQVQRELIALPSLERSAYLVEDEPDSVRFAWESLLTVPPGIARGHAALTAALAGGRHLPWRLLGAVARGRVVVAVTS